MEGGRDGQSYGWMDGGTDRLTDGLTDRLTDRQSREEVLVVATKCCDVEHESGTFPSPVSIVCYPLPSQDGSELPLKEAGPGDSVHSMLSIMDAITGHPKPFKTVTAKAIRDSYVLQ